MNLVTLTSRPPEIPLIPCMYASVVRSDVRDDFRLSPSVCTVGVNILYDVTLVWGVYAVVMTVGLSLMYVLLLMFCCCVYVFFGTPSTSNCNFNREHIITYNF